MLEKNIYRLDARKSFMIVLATFLLYVAIFGGIDLTELKFRKDEVTHIGIEEEGEGYVIYNNSDGSKTLVMDLYVEDQTRIEKTDHSIYEYKSTDKSADIYFNTIKGEDESSLDIIKGDNEMSVSPIVLGRSNSKAKESNAEGLIIEDVFADNIDQEYISFSGGVKENIILNSVTDINEFSYILDVGELTARLINNIVEVVDGDGNKEYVITAPLMTDNKGEESEDIKITLDLLTPGQYMMTILPDKEWLSSGDREYPIIIDPTYNASPSSIDDRAVRSYYPNDTGDSSYAMRAGVQSNGDTWKTYIRPNLPSSITNTDIIVVESHLNLRAFNDSDLSTTVTYGLYKLAGNWNNSTLTWNNAPATLSLYSGATVIVRKTDWWYTIDTTSYMRDCFPNGSYDHNYGVVLQALTTARNTLMEFGASNNSWYPPSFSLTYNVPISVAAPTATVHGNGANSKDGYVDLSWNAVSGANGYYVGIFNGDQYQLVRVNNVTSWSTKDKKIWPTTAQTASGIYKLQVNSSGYPTGTGDELYIFPNMAYRNAPDGTVDYDNDTNYYFIIIPYNSSGYMTVPSKCGKAVVKIPDVIEPSTPSSLTVSPAGWNSAVSHTLSWSGVQDYDGTSFETTGIGDVQYTIESGAVTTPSAGAVWISTLITDGDGSYAIDTSGLSDGVYTIFQRTVDNAGNTSANAYVNMYIDREDPTLGAGGFESDAQNWKNTDTVVFTYDTIADSGSGIDSAKIYTGLSYVGDVDIALTQYSMDTSSVTYDEGLYTLHILDNAGNEITADTYVRIDKLAPQVSISSPVDSSSVNGIVEIWGTCTDGSYASMNSYVAEVVRYDSTGAYIGTQTIESGTNAYYSSELINIVDTSTYNQGDILEIHIAAQDKVGYTSEDTVTVTVDKSVAILSNALEITAPASGGIADEESEQIFYTRDAAAAGTLDAINFFVDGSLFANIPAGDVFFETLRYDENTQHSIVFIGENSSGEFEYSQGIAMRTALSSIMEAADIATSENVIISGNTAVLANPALSGNIVFKAASLTANDLTYLVNASSLTPSGTGVTVEVSFDGGATWMAAANNTDYILDNDSSTITVKLTLTGNGTNSPTVLGTQVKCATIQNPYNITVQTVKSVEGLRIISNALGRVSIGWNSSLDPDVLYDVYRGTTSGFVPSASNKVFTQASSTVYADTSVSAGITYYYKVFATKTYPVVLPYIPFRESQASMISVTAYSPPVYTDYDENDDTTAWGNQEEIASSSNANDLYGGNWTVNNELPPPVGASEMNESMLGARTFCAAGFEPVNFVSGNFFMKQLDSTYSALPDVNSSVLRTYNTQYDEKNGPLGSGWAWYYSMHLKLYSTGDVGMVQSDGHLAMFRLQQDGTYLSDEDEQMTLTKTVDEYIVTSHDKEQTVFDSGGQLKRIVSENGNTTEVKYDERGIIDRVVFSTGKVLDLTTDDKGHITAVTLPDGSQMFYEYSGNNLVKFYDTAGDATVYEYDSAGRMTAWYDKQGARQVFNVYDSEDRVIEQWDANGYHYKLEYNDDHVLTTDGEGNKKEYYFDDMGRTIKIVDSEGYSQMYEYNANSQATKYTDKMGLVTKYEYDGRGNLTKEITNDGRSRQYKYDASNNLTGETDYLGNWTLYEYDAKGNLSKRTYPDGSAYAYEYNEKNQLVKITDPSGVSETYEYDGEKISAYTDALGAVTTYEYNGKDELIKITDAKGSVTKMEYDASGNITKTVLPDNTYMTYTYDKMGNMTVFADAKGQATKFEYDALGHMTKAINPDGTEIIYEYDGRGNLIKTTYPDGTYIVNAYDTNGGLLTTADQDGRTYTMDYNPAGDITKIIEPNATASSLKYSSNTGWLSETTDGSGAETKYEYNANGSVTKITYTDGTSTKFTYDAMGRIKTQVLYNGATTKYNYDVNGRLESIIDPMGSATWYLYDKLGQLSTVVDSLGSRTAFEYDAVGNMTSMTDANGEKITYAYDAASQLEKITAPLGASVKYSYDPNGQLQKVINALGGSAENKYDAMGRVTESTDLLGATTKYEYDVVGNLIKETNALGNSFSYEYDSNGNIIKITDAAGNEAKFQYDVMSNITKIEGEEGYAEQYEYDELGRITKSTDSEGYEKYYEYNAMGRLQKESDNTGKSITYTYTSIGQVKKITNAEGETTELFYDLNGNTTKVLYADGTAETYYYNELNQLVRQYDRAGLETTYKYDAVGNVVEVKQPSNKVYTYEYDANYNLVKMTNPEGGETTYAYDDAGNAVSVTDPMGNTTKIEYNAASMIEKVIDAKGVVALTVDYSVLGEVLAETDALGSKTQYSYDEVSRLVKVTDPLSRVTEYVYDGADNITQVIDANGNKVNYEYNTVGLLTKETDPLGNIEQYEYYVDGLLEQITKADGTSSNYAYDLAGRMTGVEYSDGTNITYGYNEVGSTTTMTDKTGTTTYQYDDMQRLVSTTDSNDKTVKYAYDILGRKTGITLPDGQTVNYEYDAMDRLIKVKDSTGIVAEYEYDKNSQLISNTRNDIVTTYDYNELGQITQLTTSDINSQIQQFTYQYDKLGNITEETRTETDTVNARTYEYDSANQLTKFTDNDYEETYAYDNVGNMLTKSINDDIINYNYNNANQLIEEIKDNQTVTYKYNENGDLISKSTGETYKYDIQGNLTAIAGNGIDKEYTYNGNGNRLSESTDGETLYYVNDVNRAYEQVLQTYNSDSVINTYTYGLQRIQSVGETTETYLYDGRGSVVGAVGSDNSVITYAYTAYGELMPSSPEPSIFGYNAEATDFETGLQYLRARYYDTGIQRFVQEDDYRGKKSLPKTLNRYIYAVDNPIRYDDPSGHRAVDDEPMVVPEFVFDKKLRSVENYINDSLENIYTPDPKMDRVEEIVNDSLSNIDGNFSDRNISNPSGEGSQYCDYNSTQYVYSDPEGNLFIVDQLIDANNIAGDILTYKGSIVLNNAGLPQTIEIIENGKYYQVSGFYQNQMSGRYLIENANKYDNLSTVIKSGNLKLAGEIIGVIADIIDLSYTGYCEYTNDPSLAQDQKIVNTSVEVGIKSLSIGAQIAAAAGIGAIAGTFITPGIGTAAGAAIAVTAVIITAAVSWLIDWGVDAITHDIKWGEEENSFADISKDYMYELYVAYSEWYEEKEKTGEVFSMGGK